MSKPLVAVTRKIPQAGLDILEGHCDIRLHDSSIPPTRDELFELLEGADAALTLLSDSIDSELLASFSDLQIVANMAVGYDNIDVDAATEQGIWLSNTPDVLTESTADLTLALILAVCRRVVESDHFMRAGEYQHWDPLLLRGMELHGKTIGIVGFGRIGQAVAHRASAFGMNILYTSRSRHDSQAEELKATYVPLKELLIQSDVVSLHTAYTSEQHHLIAADQISMMKKTAYLINTARGPLVNETDLISALQREEIAGAGLDVYEFEPEFKAGFAELTNVVMLPHIGSATFETRDAMASLAARNIIEVLSGRSPVTPINTIGK